MNKQAKTIADQIIKLLQAQNQLGLLPEIVRHLEVQSESMRRKVILESAYELDQSTVDQITQMIAKKLTYQPTVTQIVNPDLIAGIKIQIDDQLIDTSLQHQIRQLFPRQ